jgi:formylglycine-generating enzyme required for sulfatase activity
VLPDGGRAPAPTPTPNPDGGATANAGDGNKGGAAPDAGRAVPVGAAPAAAAVRTPPTARVARSFEYPTLTLDAVGKLKTRESRSATYYAEDLGGGVLLEMVEIPGGSFSMGSTDADVRAAFADNTRYNKDARLEWFTNETPQRQVTVKGFLIAKYEVTQAQYRAVMGVNPSYFKGDNLPVEQVSWNDAVEFCRRLSAKTGREYRLPSEAEWEYAARAGTTTPFAFGETITPELVNYDGNHPYAGAPKGAYRAKTMPVGSGGAANGFGLYDMHGNVWEWCLDYWHENYGGRASGAPSDGSAWLSGGDPSRRVRRGGSWSHNANYLRSANRGRYAPANRNSNVGFRVVTMART